MSPGTTVADVLRATEEAEQRNDWSRAVELWQALVQHRPHDVEWVCRWATAHAALGNHAQSQQLLQGAVERAPQHAGLWLNLGEAHRCLRQYEPAIACFRRVCELGGHIPAALNNLGLIAQEQGNHEAARQYYEQALLAGPQIADVHYNLGHLCVLTGDEHRAEQCFRRAFELRPGFLPPRIGMAALTLRQRRYDECVSWCEQALAIAPQSVEALVNLGSAWFELGDDARALEYLGRAIALHPHHKNAHNNLAVQALLSGRYTDAQRHLLTAIEHGGQDDAGVLTNWGNLNVLVGQIAEADAAYRRAAQVRSDDPGLLSNVLYCQLFRDDISAAQLLAEHDAWDARFGHIKNSQVTTAAVVARSSQRLRIGFVSPDLGEHPVGYLLQSVLPELRQHELDVYCYSNHIRRGPIADQLHGASTQWRDIVGVDDRAVAEQIRGDKIDILCDLAGHTVENRLTLFAERPAPLQVTWLGYPATTGCRAIDYLITDAYKVPLGREAWCREQIARLPYLSEGLITPRTVVQSERVDDALLLASFNNPSKLAPSVTAAWAEIMRRVPEARLLLKYRGLDDPWAQQIIAARFARLGIARERLLFEGYTSLDSMLTRLSSVDLMLDSFPFSGGLTTMWALSVGVPVVTIEGDRIAGRQSYAMLKHLGLDEFIAPDAPGYIQRAVSLAKDEPRCRAMRPMIRERYRLAPAARPGQLAADLAQLLRALAKR